MSFLSAAFLIALPLIAVPVVIHLYRGRRRDVVMWGAMHFLAAAVTKGRSMERLEELLLMALRLAAVAALVLALARPMVRSSWLGHATEREVVVVLDNSMSMSRTIDKHSAAERMREKATKFVDSLSSADGVQVLLAAGSEWATSEPVPADAAGKRRLKEIIDAAEPTLGTADLLESLQAAIHLESNEQLTGRQVVVLTDAQAGSWHSDRVGAWRQLGAECKAAETPTSIEVIDCGLDDPKVDNVAVTSLAAVKNLVRPNEPLELKAEISNTGDVASPTMHVQWLVGDKVRQDSTVPALEPHAKTQVTTTLNLADAGIFAVGCRIDRPDQVPLDQENWLVAQVAGELPVLFVQSEGDADTSSVKSSELFAAALGFKGKDATAWHAIFRPEIIAPAALAKQALLNYRAVIIDNLTELDPATVDALETFVRNGGGLWVALGNRIDPVKFNRDWYRDGDGMSPLALDSLQVIEKTDEIGNTVHPPSRDHAATAQLANTTQLDIDEARIRQHWSFAKRPTEEEPVSALLESGKGRQLVVEKYFGQGRVVIQAYPLGLDWSNMPLLKAYVVMIHDWLNYITVPTSARYNLNPGATIIATAPKDAQNATAEVVTPRGKPIALAATSADASSVFRFAQTQLPGMYRVHFTNGGPAADVPFHVSQDANESDLRTLAAADRDGILVPAGIAFSDVKTELPKATVDKPRREPIWGLLLAALVALLGSELLLANRLSRQRSGFAVSSLLTH